MVVVKIVMVEVALLPEMMVMVTAVAVTDGGDAEIYVMMVSVSGDGDNVVSSGGIIMVVMMWCW